MLFSFFGGTFGGLGITAPYSITIPASALSDGLGVNSADVAHFLNLPTGQLELLRR